MSPKTSKTAKPSSLKKKGTMIATTTSGRDYLKRSWGDNRLKLYNPLVHAQGEENATTSTSSAKPKLSKTRTMQNTTTEAKELLGQEILADTRAETKRRQANATAKKAAEKAKKQKAAPKPSLKRLGTMAKTAKEGKAYVRRTGGKSTGGRTKKST